MTEKEEEADKISHKIKCTGGGLKGGGDCGAILSRLLSYCNREKPGGSEGFVDDDSLELRYVLLTIRHGDRSAIHSIPGQYVIYIFEHSLFDVI